MSQANASQVGQDSAWALPDPTAAFSKSFEDQLTQNLLVGMDGLEFESFFNDAQFLSPFLPVEHGAGSQPENGGPITTNTADSQCWEHSTNSQNQNGRFDGDIEMGIASRLPSMEPERPEVTPLHVTPAHGLRSPPQQAQTLRQVNAIRPWKVSPEEYARTLNKFADIHSVLPNNHILPSRHTLSRFLEGYFRGFAIHTPFIHAVSFSVTSTSPELILSMCAVGALHRFQPSTGYQLYADAQALISWRMRERSRAVLGRLTNDPHTKSGALSRAKETLPSSSLDVNLQATEREDNTLQLLQAMILLTAMASWGDHGLTQDALSMSSQVAMLARESGISVPEERRPQNQTWSNGIRHEERRRTLFSAYALLNLQSVAFNVPPLLLNQEVAIELPGCASSWQAQTATEWSTLRDTYMTPRPFQERLNELLLGKRIHLEAALSSFGNYILIHGLLQQVFIAHNAAGCLSSATSALSENLIDKLQDSLRAWQESWEATYESTTDPSSPKGPLGFNSTAILRLAYVRLSANFGPSRQLLFVRDPREIAEAFSSARAINSQDRSPRLDRAVLQCIHALSIPVRVGVAFVARTQTMTWGVEHALCNLECAFLLAQWLLVISECVEASGVEALRPDERRLVIVVVGLIRETDFGDSFDEDSPSRAVQIRDLARYTMALWAQIYEGSHVFDIVGLIGSGMALLAERLE